MHSVGTRGRLLAGAALGLGLSVVAPQQALAACTYAGGVYTCAGTTTTADTVFVFPGPGATDRTIIYPAGPASTATLDVDAGAVVNGFGLAIDTPGILGPDLQVINDGTVSIDVGNTAATGGSSAALSATSTGTSITYAGTGDIANNGTGDALYVATSGAGSFTGTSSGDFSSVTGNALTADVSGTGSIDFTSTGSLTSTNLGGVFAQINGSTGGDLTLDLNAVTSNANIFAIFASSASDTGNITITTNGTVAGGGAISAAISSATATGDIAVTTNGIVNADDIGISVSNGGTGDVVVNSVGAMTVTNSYGLNAVSSGGNITIDATSITAGSLFAINAAQNDVAAAGDIDIGVTGAITGDVGIVAVNNGLGGIIVTTGAGLVSGSAGSAIAAQSLNASAADPILVTIGAGGATGTGADAVVASTIGTGTVTVNSAGPVISDTGAGIYSSATTGATAINVTAGSVNGGLDGIAADATTGNIVVTLSGGADVTGLDDAIQVSTAGAMTVGIGAGSVVDGNFGVYGFGGGTLAVTNAGTLGVIGDVAVAADLDTAANVTNQTGGVVNGRFDLSDQADVVTNAGTMNLDGAQSFYLGTDTITNQAGGILNVAAATTFTGLEALNNAGTLNAAAGLTFDAGATTLINSGILNAQGTLDFGGGADVLTNSGTGTLNINADTILAGLETFTNTGLINLNTFTLTGPAIAFANAGTIDTNGSATIAGFTSLSNIGTMDLAAGTLTVPAAAFINTGTIIADEGATTITGQTSFDNSGTLDLQDAVVGDVLTIDSDFVGSGASVLEIDFTSTAADVLVINGAASGTTTIDADFLGGGFINTGGVLVVDALTASVDAFVLGTSDTPLVDFSLVQDVGDFYLVAAPSAAAFNPLVVPGFATDLWYQSANEVFAETSKPATTAGVSLWGDAYISRDKYGDDDDSVTVDGVDFDVDNQIKTKRHGVQMGVDYGMVGARVGLTGGYGWAKANGNADADLKAKGWNLGLYGQFGAVTGFHGEMLVKHDRYKAEFDDGAFDGVEFDIKSTGFDGSLGYRFGMGADGNMDILAGLSHVRTKVDDISAFGFVYDTGKLTSTRGRAGVRGVFGGSLAPYVAATVYHEFKGNGDVELFDGADVWDLDTRGKGTWARLEAGLSGNDGPGPILALWGDLGDRKGLGLRAGWRIGGGIDAAPPPPPPPSAPPPPPEAPATQTCGDGSVILATDSCPLPPPPPPPPAPEPERG